MGRLSDYINSGGRSSSHYTAPSGGGAASNETVTISGFLENDRLLGQLMTSNPLMAKELKASIRKALKDARKNLSNDAKNYLKEDPRKAARAVKFGIYKALFGGNLSILQKRAGTAGARYELHRTRKLEANPHQRGGNRRPRGTDGRNRLDTYFGADRGFALRFIGSGTVERQTRYGNRGAIRQTNWFGRTAPWQMETAAEKVAAAINEYVKQQTNG